MRTQFRKQRIWSRWVVPVLSLSCLSYFGYHAWHGAYGPDSASALEVRRTELTERLATLTKHRLYLEKRVMLLNDGTVEADMLDERARLQLNVTREDEVVYFN